MIPSVPISFGELLDKITILEIKSGKLTSDAALTNVRRELGLLEKIADPVMRGEPRVAPLKERLKRMNETLWVIEDDIREKEAKKEFDAKFIELARAVYHNNDERGRIKREINELVKSELTEEKQYAKY